MAYGAGDKPGTRTVKVKAHQRTIQVKPQGTVDAPLSDKPVPASKLKSSERQPAAPSPAVREQHAAVAVGHALNRQRGEAVRKARTELPSAPVNQPGLPPEVRHPAGSTMPTPKVRPATFLDVFNRPKGLQATNPNADKFSAQAQREATSKEIDRHVAGLLTTGRSLHKQETSIERLRQLGVLPGTSKFQKAVDRFNAAQKASSVPKKEHHGGLATILGSADALLSGKALANAASDAGNWVAKNAGEGAIHQFDKVPGLSGSGVAKWVGKEVGRAGNDVVDLAANAIPSLYVPTKEAVTGHPVKAAEMVAKPFIDTAKDPIGSAGKHPLATLLIARGGEGAVGHGIGKALRTAPSKTLKRAGSIERGTATVRGANTHMTEDRLYGKDALVKAGQVFADKRRARKGGEPGGRKGSAMSGPEIKRRTNELSSASQDIQRLNRGNVVHEGRTILAQRGPMAKLRGNRATAAVTLAAQHIADTPAELRAYMAHLENTSHSLTGDKLRRNKQTRRDIQRALRRGRPKNAEQAAKYAELNVRLQKQLAELDIIDPKQMEQARLMAYATSPVKGMGARMLAPAETKAHVDAAVKARDAAKTKLDAAKRDFIASTHAEGMAHGRGQILSRNVGGVAAEDAASKVRAPTFEGGGHGFDQAHQRLVAQSAEVLKQSQRVKEAEAALAAARRTHQEGGHLVDQAGAKVTPEDIRAHMAQAGITDEPAFITHAPNQRGARNFTAHSDQAPGYFGPKRTGAAVVKGTADLTPEVMIEQLARTQGLIDSAHRFRALIEEMGHRTPDDKVYAVDSYQEAARDAADMLVDHKTGEPVPHATRMVPVRLNPLGGRRAQLEKTLEAANQDAAHDHINEQLNNALTAADKTSPGKWGLIPEVGAKTMSQHLTMGKTSFDKAFQMYGGQFRKTVLALSPKWLTGNTVEAALRTMIAHAGPRSAYTGHQAQKQYEQMYGKEAAADLKSRTVGGGHMSLAHRTDIRVGSEAFADSARAIATFAEWMGKARRTPGPKQVADGWNVLTHFVMQSVNGRIEHAFQTTMFGKALREHPLMSDRTVKLSKAAIDDAVKGLHNTNAQVRLGREVDRMYGRYSKFSPSMRKMVSGYTPFIAWYLNSVRFLFDVLPRDHPVLTSVIASANEATAEWRKQHGMIASFVDLLPGAPDYLQGSIPGKAGSNLRVSRYTPFGIFAQEGGPLNGFMNAILPQAQGVMQNAAGLDWKGSKLNRAGTPQLGRLLASAVSVIENMVPFASQAVTVTGAHLPNEAEGAQKPPTVAGRLRKAYDPGMYAQSAKGAPSKITISSALASGIPGVPTLKLPALPPLPAIR